VRKYHSTLLILAITSLLGVAMVAFRVSRTGYYTFYFLIWNLFLAWIPLILSIFIETLFRRKRKVDVFMVALGIIWVLFYPNAPYILTDLIHIQTRAPIPVWFDAILVLSFAWTGLFTGFVSLFILQNIIRKIAGSFASWVFVTISIGLGSFGVFLGRFLRWNSWDFFTSPKAVTHEVIGLVLDPLADKWSLLFTVVFSAFSLFTYLLLYTFSKLHKEWEE
jgi:uncharacterized membrane protein